MKNIPLILILSSGWIPIFLIRSFVSWFLFYEHQNNQKNRTSKKHKRHQKNHIKKGIDNDDKKLIWKKYTIYADFLELW